MKNDVIGFLTMVAGLKLSSLHAYVYCMYGGGGGLPLSHHYVLALTLKD